MKILALLFAALSIALSASAQNFQPVKVINAADWYKLGPAFGPAQSWQFGFDKSATAGGCVQRELHDGQWLAGPCRDVLLLAKDGEHRAHLGAAVMYNAERGNATYSIRAGVNAGPILRATLVLALNRLPYLENVADFQAPKFLAYLGDITTVDYAVGYRPTHSKDVIGNWTHGPMVKLDLPLADVYNLLKLGL